MPLPTTEVQAFAPPAVKDGELILPVRVRGELHGLRAPLHLWVGAAREVITAAEVRRRARRSEDAAGAVLKPSGSIL